MIKNLWHRLQLVYQYSEKSSLSALFVSIPNFKTMDDETLLSALEEKYLPDANENNQPIVCPVCGHTMKDHSWTSSGYDSDNEWNSWGETLYICHYCHTQKVDDEWNIPEAYKASEKQLRCAEFIASKTGKPLPPPTKKLIWNYVHDNIEQAKKINQKHYESSIEQFCDDFPEAVPAYDELC